MTTTAGEVAIGHRGRLATFARGTGTGSQFSRFLAVGLVCDGLYGLMFLGLSGIGAQLANTIGFLASTMLANEAHRRLTFRADGRVPWWTAQLEAGGLAVAGLVCSSLALEVLGRLVPNPTTLQQLLLLALVTFTLGLVRFVALRFWVFRRGRTQEP